MLRAVFEKYHRHRFAGLFLTLLFTLGGYPLLKALGFGFSFLEAMLIANLVAATASVARERGFRVLLVLGLAILVLRGLQVLVGARVLLPLSEAVWVLACLLATAAAARHALGAGAVDGERIFAALDVYLLAGLMFSMGYWMLDRAWPMSFTAHSTAGFDLPQAIYFSFVTIATLGYGDIVPASEAARGLAILEAVGGQTYIAVLVARLVSSYGGQRERSSKSADPDGKR